MASKPRIQLFKEQAVTSCVINHGRGETAKRRLIGLTSTASIKIGWLHTTANSAFTTDRQRSANNHNFIRKAKGVLKASRSRYFDRRKGIARRRNRTADRIENPQRKLLYENGVHNAIEPCNRIGRDKSSRSEDVTSNAALLVQNIPAKLFGKSIDDIRPRHVQRFGKNV